MFYVRKLLDRGLRAAAAGLLLCLPLAACADLNSAMETSHRQEEAVRLNNIGTALMSQQFLDKAAVRFDQAYKLDPSLTVAELNKGIALFYLQRLPEAATALEHAAEQDPKSPRSWYVLGLLYRSDSKPQQAIEAFRRVIALDPSSADSHYMIGSFELEAHNLAAAETEYRAALKINPLHASAEFGLARALQRQGNVDQARVAFERFQQLTTQKISFPFSHTYGEEGSLGRAEDATTNMPKVAPMIPVTFTKSWESADDAALKSVKPSTGAACLIDPEKSGRSDLIVMSSGASSVQMFRSNGAGQFELIPSSQTGLDVSGEGVACAVGDFDNDGLPDIALAVNDRVLLFRNMGGGKFQDVTAEAGLSAKNHPSGITFVDYDHDGDLDLFVTGETGKGSNSGATPDVLWRNNGDNTFTDWTRQAGLGGEGSTTASVLTDLNNDRAVDLIVTGSGSSPVFFANPREGAFHASPLFSAQGLPPTTGVITLDYNKDGWMDVALVHAGAPGITLWKNIDGKRFERVSIPLQDATMGWSVAPIDIDNDGWIDLAMVIETANGSALRVLRNLGPRGFEDISHQLRLDDPVLKSARSVLAADLNDDGAADLIVMHEDGMKSAWLNRGGEKNHSLKIALTGFADNKSALGTKVDVFADGMWQKWEVTGTQEIIAGLGAAPKADLVRLLWPTGVPQDEIDVPAHDELKLTELDRRGSSCPTLFAWDGARFGFVSDVIGAAVVGHWVSPAQRNTPDPDEWIKIDGAQLKARDGKLGLRFGEPMEEVNFVDQVRLVAIDHPAGSEVTPNEGFRSERPFASGETVVVQKPRAPLAAWDDHGQDALPLLRAVDHRYVKDFTNLSFAGFANQHTLTLDLGDWNPADPLRLLLHGFVEYFSASSMYSAWQAGISPIPPYVEAQLADGSWRRIVDDMGFPAGLPRTIVVDLTGKMPAGSRRIRLVTNLQIYWDQILIDNNSVRTSMVEKAETHETELPLVSASLAFRGYPRQLDGVTSGDLNYDYQRMSHTGPFVPQRGAYTHYGDVTPLLKAVDDEYVIFGTGEDMDLEFNAAAQPPLPAGWVRDYFFYANGFVKDMDFYESSPFTVDSMPFHAMSSYPYPNTEHYPQDAKHTAYQLEWNDRFESGAATSSYKFSYRPTSSAPITNEVEVPR